ncbi:hypothetical protein PLICRDRAFT_174399 [Plicaturopsis crispa FD-325 SS-3]|nr:hypothetical protein PLICRDRAFT_174399 [Plicaturopsis crispa FD-325 SS-3]
MSSATKSAGPKVVVIGAGIGGLSFGIAMKRQLQYENFTIYERAGEVGGTWRDNTYPGCASDVPIHFFCLSTDLNPDWNKTHGSQPEIQAYWKGLAAKYDLYKHTVFRTQVISADWNMETQQYHIVLEDVDSGVKSETTANVVVSALGILEQPRYPADMKGIHSFKGDIFHSARWNHNVKLSGKRVAVVGSGCSAAQFIPIIAQDPTVQITNFIRTPNWYIDRERTFWSPRAKWVFRNIPLVMKAYRNIIMLGGEVAYGFFQISALSGIAKNALTRYMLKIAPEKYREQLVPSYSPGCRRVIIDTEYLESLSRPNVSANFDGINEVVEDGIITGKGEKIAFDVIILATGYETQSYPLAVRGVGGQTIQEYYDSQGGPTAYIGTTLPGFPNFYLIGGPNTLTGHTSVIFTEECQINYALSLISPVINEKVSSFEVKQEPTDAYNVKIQRRLSTTVYSECFSWYRYGGNGKLTSPFPGPVTMFWWYLRTPVWSHYKAVGAEKWLQEQKRKKLGDVLGLAMAVSGLVLAVKYGASVPGSAFLLDNLAHTRQSFVDVWTVARELFA